MLLTTEHGFSVLCFKIIMRVIAIIIVFVSALVFLLFGFKAQADPAKANSFHFSSYQQIYQLGVDSLVKKNSLNDVCLTLDSLFYFNPQKTAFVTCLHKSFSKPQFADELSFVYGEKINDQWFFFEGSTYILPRLLYNSFDSVPLNYSQFHTVALEDVFFPFALSGKFDFSNSPFLQTHCVAGKTDNKF